MTSVDPPSAAASGGSPDATLPLRIDGALESAWKSMKSSGFHIRGVSLGVNCLGTTLPSPAFDDRLRCSATRFLQAVDDTACRWDVPVLSRRIALTPACLLPVVSSPAAVVEFAQACDHAVATINRAGVSSGSISFIGGIVARVDRGLSRNNTAVLDAMPQVLRSTKHVCCTANVASSRCGLNLRAIERSAAIVKEVSSKPGEEWRCARFAVTSNGPMRSPFMPAAFHGTEQGDLAVSVSLGVAGVLYDAVARCNGGGVSRLFREIQDRLFIAARAGQAFGEQVASEIGAEFRVVDLSIAPMVEPRANSIAAILRAIGVENCGNPGTTCALSILLAAIKRGGLAGAVDVGGLSGAFLPVSEDAEMIASEMSGAMTLEKLEALSAVSCVGLDMFGVPGDVGADVIAGVMVDEMTLGLVQGKATAVRHVPVNGAKVGDIIDLAEHDPLLGRVLVMKVPSSGCARLIERGRESGLPANPRFAVHM